MTITAPTITREQKVQHPIRKWSGVVWLLIEVNLLGGTIFGFPALFKILPQYGIYTNNKDCLSSVNITEIGSGELSCEGYQTRQYQVGVYVRSIVLLFMCGIECINIGYYII